GAERQLWRRLESAARGTRRAPAIGREAVLVAQRGRDVVMAEQHPRSQLLAPVDGIGRAKRRVLRIRIGERGVGEGSEVHDPSLVARARTLEQVLPESSPSGVSGARVPGSPPWRTSPRAPCTSPRTRSGLWPTGTRGVAASVSPILPRT